MVVKLDEVDVDTLDLGGLREQSEDQDDDLLADSLEKEQQSPITVGPLVNGKRVIYDGNRRARAARKKGLKKLLARLLDRAPTPDELALYQLISDIHKKHLRPYERSMGILAVEKANPGLTSKQLAALIPMEESLCWRYLQIKRLGPKTLEAYKGGELSLTAMVEVAKLPLEEQPAMLGVEGGRDGFARERKRRERADTPVDRTQRIKIPLAVNTDEISVHGTVTVAGSPGSEIDFEEAENILKAALKAVKDAQKNGWGLKAAQAAWKDSAKAAV